MYSDSIDALCQLLIDHATNKKGSKCYINRLSSSPCVATNGLEYTFVEVTCDDGIQYGIQAFGLEAIELFREAKKFLSTGDQKK